MAEYYYLVAGLPDIAQGAAKKGLLYDQVLEEIRSELNDEDRALLAMLMYRFDCDNINAMLAGKDDFDDRGYYSREELETEINSPEKVPTFIKTFLEARKEGKALFPTLGENEQLLAAYYEEGLKSENKFIREWVSFELDLSNVIAGKSARLLGISPEKSVIPLNDTAEKIAKSTAADFGLSGHFSWFETIMSGFGTPKKLENAIDTVRWEKAEEISEQNYFSIEAVLAFAVKLNSVARWMALDPENGIAKMEELLAGMKSMVQRAEMQN